MISSEIFIIKRDGKKEAFSLDKIKNAISKAFLSVGSFATQDVITNVLSRVSISDGTNVEEIQNQVEVALMAEHYYSVAKAYMLYRQKHLEDREVRDKLKFLMDYCDASNPASGGKQEYRHTDRRTAQIQFHPPQPPPADRPFEGYVW